MSGPGDMVEAIKRWREAEPSPVCGGSRLLWGWASVPLFASVPSLLPAKPHGNGSISEWARRSAHLRDGKSVGSAVSDVLRRWESRGLVRRVDGLTPTVEVLSPSLYDPTCFKGFSNGRPKLQHNEDEQ